jgi:hypothetical protein
VFDLAGGQTHFAGATTATSTAEHDARAPSEDNGQYSLPGATGDRAANRPQCDRVQARRASSRVDSVTTRDGLRVDAQERLVQLL